MTKLTQVGFLTYNTLENISSGWHEKNGHKALVLQNTKGNGSRRVGQRDMSTQKVRDEIKQMWAEFNRNIKDLDHVVVYVGDRGSEQAIVLAAQLPAEKVTFIGCTCGLPIKEAMIQMCGLVDANRILCECGGHYTMEALIQSFLETGQVGNLG